MQKMHENRGQGGVELDLKFRISKCLFKIMLAKKSLHPRAVLLPERAEHVFLPLFLRAVPKVA